ncbi:TolC family protein [Stygiobacter electus]|uniref:TolC family protein n=1 Tax=Stygiobacter electus TaxID=3032292 RepID=A0AAE3TCP5_9BACT|nr:TolC family protein [Stygiobacter electus]MDF1612150.1 TolC family protein [Stygiobacter electus]
MKKAILLLTIFSVSIFAQKQLTLDEAIKIALQKNPNLIKLQNSLSGNQTQLKNAYGELLPSLGAQASWSWQRIDDAGSQQRNFLGEIVTIPPSTVENRSYSAGIGGNVMLFNGLANYANINLQKDNLKATEYNIAKLKQNIVYQTSDFFYSVLNAEELMKVREENLKYFQKFYESVNERNKLGLVPVADVYSAQVQLGNAELALIQAQNDYDKLKNGLLTYLALNVMDDYQLVDPFAKDKTVDPNSYLKNFEDIQTLVNVALDNRFDFKSQQLLVKAAESNLTIAKSGIFPTLSADYSYGSGAIDINKMFDRKSFRVGMTLSIPIFSNFSTENQIQQAEINKMNQHEDLLSLERQIKIEIKQGYNDLIAAKKSLDVASKNVLAAEENRKINLERYNLGSATILEVLQSDRDYIDAIRNKINNVYDFYRKYDNLNNVIGRLDFSKYE